MQNYQQERKHTQYSYSCREQHSGAVNPKARKDTFFTSFLKQLGNTRFLFLQSASSQGH